MVKHGGASVMVWTLILSVCVSHLVFIDGQMNEEYYLNTLKGSLCQSAEKMGIVGWFKFYQDNPASKKR